MDNSLFEKVLRGEIPLESLEKADKLAFLDLLEEKEKRLDVTAGQTSLIEFAKQVYPNYSVGAHHRKMAKIFEDVAAGRKKRVIINIAPRHGKSELTSYLFPAWFLGQRPDAKIIMATHTASLSEQFGRRVRNLIDGEDYQRIFPETQLASDSKSAGSWGTTDHGQYYAVGVGGALAGRGADLLVIDDPHSEQDVKSGTGTVFEQARSWYQTGPRQRLMWGGAIIVVMCMTGDTPVLMEDGTEKPLRDVQLGDIVATFDAGQLATSKVLGHKSNGVDSIYQIQTRSGRILRANERHPFLVLNEGVLEWTRLKNLRAGDELVSLKDAQDLHGQKQSPGCAERVWRRSHTTESTQMRQSILSDIMESTKEKRAPLTGATNQRRAKACVKPATTKSAGQTEQRSGLQSTTAQNGLSIDTASLPSSTTQWLKNAATRVMSAAKLLLTLTLERTGITSSASTITMTPEQFEDFCATIATLRSGTERRQKYLNELHRISDFTVDPIVSISYAGEEEVFDVQIERTENFIANGVVSHNTRWSQLDLTGMLLEYQANNPDADQWEVVELPAILEVKNEKTGEVVEKSLWPEKWPLEELQLARASMDPRYWNAQYMQNPTSDAVAVIKREAWREWPTTRPPTCDFIIQTWDTAFEAKTTSDFSACTTWGVFYNEDENNEAQVILLDAFKDRMEFPELKAYVKKHYDEWEPDILMVEKKASGAPLIYELRTMGIPVSEYTPSRGTANSPNNKVARLNAISDIFASGKVWAPPTRWARDVIEEVASFPVAAHDDYVDCVSMAMLRVRQGGFIRTNLDEPEDVPYFKSSRKAAYY